MRKIIMTQENPGHVVAKSADLFDTFEIHRIDREFIDSAPETAGIYLLYGADPQGKVAAYVGKSTTSLKTRVSNHKKDKNKEWFGTIYAVPLPDPNLCGAVEADLIYAIEEVGVVKIRDNKQPEERFRESEDVHVGEMLEKVKVGIELVLGSPIFSGEVESTKGGAKELSKQTQKSALERKYQGPAAKIRERTSDDSDQATHSWVGAGIKAWGRFVGKEPENQFTVLAGSGWRVPILDPTYTTYDLQLKVAAEQNKLIDDGILDKSNMTFNKDHVFENWTRASKVVSGKAQYSGGYHWQRLKGKSA